MKTKSGKRIFAIIAVILFAVMAIIIPIYATAKGIKVNAAEIETPTENNSIPFEQITTNGDIQTEPTQDFLYFECHNSQGWYRVDLKLSKAIEWNYFVMKFTYTSEFNGGIAQADFLNSGTKTGQYNINNAEYNTVQITQANIINKSGTQFDTLRIWLNYGQNTGSTNYIMFYLLSIVDMNETSTPIVYYESFLYGILENRQQAGYDQGYTAGETAGQQAGYDQGYTAGETAGQQAGYDQGYTAGETAGKETGYNQGYAEGYDQGAIANINPLTTFLKPVDSFLNTPIFGSISIGNILSVGLFVTVAIIFIKMFAGG